MKIQFVKLTDAAILPKYNHESDAGLDVFATKDMVVYGLIRTFFRRKKIKNRILMPTDLAWSCEVKKTCKGYLKVEDTSGNAWKHGLKSMAGVIDADYRGNIGVVLVNTGMFDVKISKGDKIAQLIAYEIPKVTVSEADTLTETERGDKGFGKSSGGIGDQRKEK